MRPIGFSTGALAYEDFRRGLILTRAAGCHVIELSALRQAELFPLLDTWIRLMSRDSIMFPSMLLVFSRRLGRHKHGIDFESTPGEVGPSFFTQMRCATSPVGANWVTFCA
jgi:hypothetical protein